MRVGSMMAPMKVEEFLDQYLDKRWLLLNGSSDRYESLVPWSDLNARLHKLRLAPGSARMKLVKDGNEVGGDKYLRHSVWGSIVRTGAFERQLSDGATLVLNGVDELFDEIRELTHDAEEAFGRFAWVNLYAGWRTQKGFDLHWDDHDTLILQVHGRKAWTVYAPTCDWPTKEFAGSRIQPTEPPVWEGILQAGSLLYMPRGWWHVAIPLDEPTLHVTLGLRALKGEDLFQDLVTQLHSEAVFRRNCPSRGDRSGREAYLVELRRAVLNNLSADCLERAEQNALARAVRVPPPALPVAVSATPKLTPESKVILAGAGRFTVATATGSDKFVITTNSGEWSCDPRIAGVLVNLSGKSEIRFGDLCRGLPQSLVAELQLLVVTLQLAGELLIRQPSAPERTLTPVRQTA